MNIDDKTNELIEDYISGKLSQSESEIIEQRIKSEPELRKAVQMEKSIQAAYSDQAKDQIKIRIKSLENTLEKENYYQPTKIITMKNRIKPIISVAAFIAIAVCSFLYFQSQEIDNQEDLFSSYIKKDMSYSNDAIASFGTRGGGGGDEAATKKSNTLKSIFQNLDKGNYLDTRKLALEYLELYPDDIEAKYAMATSHLYEGNYAKAIEWYGKLRQADSRDIRHEAEYYYGLCHVKVENGEAKAKKILQGVADDNTSEWQQTAKHYLGDIE